MSKRKRSLVYRCRVSFEQQKLLLVLFSTGATARAAARAAGVNRNTATRIFRIFRRRIAIHRTAIAPFCGVCEIDECYISGGVGGRNAARQGRSLAGKFAVVGVAQRDPATGTRRLHLQRLHRVNTLTLSRFALDTVVPGSTVHTDQLASYKLESLGYVHKRVNHSRMFKDFRTGACTNNIESAWSVLRRHFGRFCGGWRHHLREWLAEIEMRYECGVARFHDELFKILLSPVPALSS